MRVFETYEEIEAYLMRNSVEAITDIANSVLIMVKEYVMTNLYGKYYPKDYDRTYNFLDCFKVKILPRSSAREYGFQIYVDYAMIRPSSGINGKWNQHQNVWGEDVSKLIPLWMDEGHGGLATQKGIGYVKYIMDLFRNDSLVKSKLRKKFDYIGTEAGGTTYSGSFTNIGMNFNFK